MAASRKKVSEKTEPTINQNIKDMIIQALIEKMGHDIVDIDMRKMDNVIFDDFIVCTATSKPHAETLCDFVQELVWKESRQKPYFIEGLENKEWIILDFFNIIVHIFLPETREFYNLENLWSDAEISRF